MHFYYLVSIKRVMDLIYSRFLMTLGHGYKHQLTNGLCLLSACKPQIFFFIFSFVLGCLGVSRDHFLDRLSNHISDIVFWLLIFLWLQGALTAEILCLILLYSTQHLEQCRRSINTWLICEDSTVAQFSQSWLKSHYLFFFFGSHQCYSG